jgi:hypothetical protein
MYLVVGSFHLKNKPWQHMVAVRIILSPSKNRLCALPCTFNKSTQIENVGDGVLMFFFETHGNCGGYACFEISFPPKTTLNL